MDEYPDHEFTTAEIFEALRPLMPEAEAYRISAFIAEPVDLDAILAEPPHNQDGPGVPYWSIPTVNFTPDTLILLSLVSAETAAKVERYRARMRDAGAISARDDEEWQRRRKEITAWKEKGFPRASDSETDPGTPAT